jgi:glutathione S-transferase
MRLTLVIGSRNLSSWSFRPWLALRQAALPFEEEVIPLRHADSAQRIAARSPSGRVPVLLIDGRPVWDSLAICETVAELANSLWPEEPLTRAHARAISAEMHSGFADLRTFLPMDFTARFGPPGRLLRGVERDIARIQAIWRECRERHGDDGPFLFGRFTIADAMYAPVVSRFVTYAVELDPPAAAYVAAMQCLPAWAEWAAAAAAEAGVEAQPPPASPAMARPEPVLLPPRGPLASEPTEPRARQPEPAIAPSLGRPPVPRGPEIKPIGDGIHRRR